MYRIDDFKSKMGEQIESEVLEHILNNFFLSSHSIEKLNDRSNLLIKYKDGNVNKKLTKANIINDIRQNMVLAYYNTDGSVNIAVSEYNYYVFEYQDESASEYVQDKWRLVTYKEPSWYGINIYDKQQMAKNGYDRKY